MKTYAGFYGYTYYFKDGVLLASPSNADGTFDEGGELEVDDFVEPLTEEQLKHVLVQLTV